jgi:hypothetical protein
MSIVKKTSALSAYSLKLCLLAWSWLNSFESVPSTEYIFFSPTVVPLVSVAGNILKGIIEHHFFSFF